MTNSGRHEDDSSPSESSEGASESPSNAYEAPPIEQSQDTPPEPSRPWESIDWQTSAPQPSDETSRSSDEPSRSSDEPSRSSDESGRPPFSPPDYSPPPSYPPSYSPQGYPPPGGGHHAIAQL